MAGIIWKKKVVDQIFDKTQQALLVVGYRLEREIKKSMKKQGEGRMYLSGKNRDIAHYASAPGKPPAVDTGRLRASISTNWTGSGLAHGVVGTKADSDEGVGQPKGASKDQFRVVVGSNVAYAPFLEWGTRRMAARPFMRPAFDRIRGRVEKLIAQSTGVDVSIFRPKE